MLLPSALATLIDLSPNDPKLYYNKALLYWYNSQNDLALQTFRKAINLKPDYRDAYYGIYVFDADMKKYAEAKNILTEYLNQVNGKDTEFIKLRNELK